VSRWATVSYSAGFRVSPSADRIQNFLTTVNYCCCFADNDDIHHLKNGSSGPFIVQCNYSSVGGPLYVGEGAKPFFIPLRALLVGDCPNLLVAGKTMSQTFHANSNTRLHPSEWTSGVAAGGTAVLMVQNKWSSADALRNVATVQKFLNSSAVGQPLLWAGLPPADDPVGWVCELGRCIHVGSSGADATRSAGGVIYNTSSCSGVCSALGPREWVASNADWLPWHTTTNDIRATVATSLKKSTTAAVQQPPDDVRLAPAGMLCRKLANTTFDGHFLCTPEVNFSTGYGSACELGRCFPVGAAAAAQANASRRLSAGADCQTAACSSSSAGTPPHLAEDEWLAEATAWTRSPTHPSDLNANVPTYLLKVAANAGDLPPEQKLAVRAVFVETNRYFNGNHVEFTRIFGFSAEFDGSFGAAGVLMQAGCRRAVCWALAVQPPGVASSGVATMVPSAAHIVR
jgi:hypothetical protein